MCGIAAVFRFDREAVDPFDLRRMCSAIAHRGPDDAGFALLAGGAVGLGHVRLSIIDLAGGDQPLFNEDHSLGLVCNGEIYDYKEIRRDLIGRGHRFRTASDNEVILHLYEEYGLDFVDHLNGEYAFVLWDGRAQRLVAVKDRCGIKPLYYFRSGAELIVCSEIKGIFTLDRVPRGLSTRYLTGPALGAFPRDGSPFDGIACLQPGHMLVADRDGVQPERAYYTPSFDVDKSMSFDAAVEAVRDGLTAAVRRRMVADVPVHAYLSGGMDSSILVGLMAKAGASFTAFNVGFPDSPYDEAPKARAIAEHYGQSFETIPCSQEDLAGCIAPAIFSTEMPLLNYNSAAKRLLSGYVRSRGVKVCLTGEGADEVFAGYPYFKLEAIWRLMRGSADERARGEALYERFCQLESRSEGYLWDKTQEWRNPDHPFGYPCYHYHRAEYASNMARVLFNPETLALTDDDSPLGVMKRSFCADAMQRLHPLNATRLVTFNQLYGVIIPTLGDRVEMANSLECRTPFMDRRMLELAGTIPPEYFLDIDRLHGKHLLRTAFRELLPDSFHKEHKHPFLSPRWSTFAKTKAGAELFEDALSPETIRRAGIFHPYAVDRAQHAWRRPDLRPQKAKQVDTMIGMIMSVHVLFKLFVEHPIACDPEFTMADRSPA